jgi:parallel beta-helix repeat protein
MALPVPHKYPPEVDPASWNAMVDFYNGFAPAGNFKNTCDFVVATDGTYYYSNNAFQLIYGGAGNAGSVDGSDFDAVLAATLTAIGNKGKIHIKGGVYPTDGINIRNTVAVTDNDQQWIEIEGEGMGNTILRGNTDSAGAASYNGAFADRAWLMIDSYNQTGIRTYLHDFQVDGQLDSNSANPHGVILRYGRDAMINRVYVRRCSKSGIRIVGPNSAYRGITVMNCQVYDINNYGRTVADDYDAVGINLSDGVADTWLLNNFIGWIGYPVIPETSTPAYTTWKGTGILMSDSCQAKGNTVWAVKNGLRTYQDIKDPIITDNYFDFSGTTAIFLDSCQNAVCNNNTIRFPYTYGIYLVDSQYNSIKLNKFQLRATYSSVNFINETSGSDYNEITNNDCRTLVPNTWTAINPVGDNTIIQNNESVNPFGVVGTPFKAANTSISWLGDTATPTASTDYTIMHSDAIIFSTDSSNNNCQIYVKNPAGIGINGSAFSTLSGVHVPVGHKITWGAFTGSAPTVKVLFL